MNYGRLILLYLSLKYQGEWEEMEQAVTRKEEIPRDELPMIEKKIKCKYVTILDDDYPDCFRNIIRPPMVLYYYGDLSLISDYARCVTIVGSRKPSEKAFEHIRKIAQETSERGLVVVSGLARGIDTAAAVGSIDSGRCVGVLGSGIDYCYPSENAALQKRMCECGLVISEYPNKTQPLAAHFPARNRLLAAIGYATISGGMSRYSGTMITVAMALSLGRDVGCLPYSFDDDNMNNALIKDGAALIQTAQDVIDLFPPSTIRNCKQPEKNF